MGFEGEGEGLPFGEEGEAVGAECVERGGGALGVGGGGEVSELLFGGGDLGFYDGDFLFDGGEAVFDLFLFDRVEAFLG